MLKGERGRDQVHVVRDRVLVLMRIEYGVHSEVQGTTAHTRYASSRSRKVSRRSTGSWLGSTKTCTVGAKGLDGAAIADNSCEMGHQPEIGLGEKKC